MATSFLLLNHFLPSHPSYCEELRSKRYIRSQEVSESIIIVRIIEDMQNSGEEDVLAMKSELGKLK